MKILSKNNVLLTFFSLNMMGVFGHNKADSIHKIEKINNIENVDTKTTNLPHWDNVLVGIDRAYSQDSEFKKKFIQDLNAINDFDIVQKLYGNIDVFREKMADDLGVRKLYAKTPLEKIKITDKKNGSHHFGYGYNKNGDFSYKINMSSNEEKYKNAYVNNGIMSLFLLSQIYVHELAHAVNSQTSKDNYKPLKHQIIKDERHAVADLLREKYNNNPEAVKFINVLNASMNRTQSRPKDAKAYEWQMLNSKVRGERKLIEQGYLTQLGAVKIDGHLIADDPLFQDFEALNKAHNESGVKKIKVPKIGHAVHQGGHEAYAIDKGNQLILELEQRFQKQGIPFFAVMQGAYSSTEDVTSRQIKTPIISLNDVRKNPQTMIFGEYDEKYAKRVAEIEDNNLNSNVMHNDDETYVATAKDFKSSIADIVKEKASYADYAADKNQRNTTTLKQ